MKQDEDIIKKVLHERFRNDTIEPSKPMFDTIYDKVERNKPRFNYRIWYGAAAAIIVVFGLGALLTLPQKKANRTKIQITNTETLQNEDTILQKPIPALGDHQDHKNVLTTTEDATVAKSDQEKKKYTKLANRSTPKTFTSQKQSRTIKLNDKSMLTLRPLSQIKFLNTEQGDRIVNLNGSAFFNVAKDTNRPFIVKGRHSNIRVTGTSFIMSSEKNEDKITLIEGSVTISHLKTGRSKQMVPGQSYSMHSDGLTLLKTSPNQFAWKTGTLSYKNSTIRTLIQDLRKNFDIHVTVQDSLLLQCSYTGTFKKNSPEKILQIVNMTLGTVLQKKNDTFVIVGQNNCFR
ncbi:FecR domain-containing protein [Aquimarina sp. U1-2]|uniref:FecR family protein n=1 Tax=Aquimarina sp. U1-2 TaxID=2823141 RepID=UPI001AEC8D3D|nr:FecR domain-containing protein [Aquimarina sp. U1-2]MBP2834053.1 FecR domain-containing protein [Aquimarina sp. U1-2]